MDTITRPFIHFLDTDIFATHIAVKFVNVNSFLKLKNSLDVVPDLSSTDVIFHG